MSHNKGVKEILEDIDNNKPVIAKCKLKELLEEGN